MAETIWTFDAGTEGQAIAWASEGFDSGNANLMTRKGAASLHGAFGAEIPANSLDYVGVKTHAGATKVEAIIHMQLNGTVPADLQFGIQIRYDASSVALRNHFTSAGGRNPRLIGAGPTTLWTGTSVDIQALATAATWLRIGLYAECGATAGTGKARLAGFVGNDAGVIAGFDSGLLENVNLGGTTLAQTRFGKLNTGTLTAAAKVDTLILRTDTDATSNFAPYGVSAEVATPPASSSLTVSTAIVAAAAVAGAVSAALTLTAPVPTLDAETVITGGGPAAITATTPAPAVTGERHAATAVPSAVGTVHPMAPAAAGSAIATGTTVAVTLGVAPPQVSTAGHGTIAAPAAAATFTGQAPAVSAVRHIIAAAPTVAVTTATLPPVAVGQRQATIAAPAAAGSMQTSDPALSTTADPSVPMVAVMAALEPPAVTGQQHVTLLPPTVSIITSAAAAGVDAARNPVVEVPMVIAVLAACAPDLWVVAAETPSDRQISIPAESRIAAIRAR